MIGLIELLIRKITVKNKWNVIISWLFNVRKDTINVRMIFTKATQQQRKNTVPFTTSINATWLRVCKAFWLFATVSGLERRVRWRRILKYIVKLAINSRNHTTSHIIKSIDSISLPSVLTLHTLYVIGYFR